MKFQKSKDLKKNKIRQNYLDMKGGKNEVRWVTDQIKS